MTVEVSRDLKEVIVWRYIAELMRRYPDRLWTYQAERDTWDEASQPNLLRVAIAYPDFEGCWADFDLFDGDVVRFHRPDSPDGSFDMPGIWEMSVAHHHLHEVLNHLEVDIGLHGYIHGQMPATTGTTLVYRILAGLAAAVAFDNHRWRWVNAVRRAPEDWQGAKLRNDLVRAFPALDIPDPRYSDIANGRNDPSYRYWILTRDQQPVVCVSTEGFAHLRKGRELDLMAIYETTRKGSTPGRVGPVVAAIGLDFLP